MFKMCLIKYSGSFHVGQVSYVVLVFMIEVLDGSAWGEIDYFCLV